MKYKVIAVLVLCMLFISSTVNAINFKADEVYNSVVVIHTSSASGSGFAIEENVILTNAHVVENYSSVNVELYDKTKITGKVIKVDENIDLALVQVNTNLTPLTLNTDTPEIGQDVYVIGAPKDMSYTMTKGIVSALDRTLGGNKYIQIDASVNSGNSGGPLLDEDGKVLGVITLKHTDAEGIGFAVRAEDVERFINDIPFEEMPEDENGNENGNENLLPRLPILIDMLPSDNILAMALIVSIMFNIGLSVVVVCLIVKNAKKNNDNPKIDYWD